MTARDTGPIFADLDDGPHSCARARGEEPVEPAPVPGLAVALVELAFACSPLALYASLAA